MDIQKDMQNFSSHVMREYGESVLFNNHKPVDLRHAELFKAWQAAKANAVPEGFALVKKVHPDAIVHNQGLGLFKECQIIYGWDGKSKDFKDALNKGFYHGVKLGAKAVLETAMIEAQESANEL